MNSKINNKVATGPTEASSPKSSVARSTRSGSIADLRVYGLARQLEDATVALVEQLPKSEAFALGNDLRRSASGAAHYVYNAHRRYSYTTKLDSLYAAVAETEQTIKLLAIYTTSGYGSTELLDEYAKGVIRQCWGLIKYIKTRQATVMSSSASRSVDELVSARS
jgi:four helix bundle protein